MDIECPVCNTQNENYNEYSDGESDVWEFHCSECGTEYEYIVYHPFSTEPDSTIITELDEDGEETGRDHYDLNSCPYCGNDDFDKNEEFDSYEDEDQCSVSYHCSCSNCDRVFHLTEIFYRTDEEVIEIVNKPDHNLISTWIAFKRKLFSL